MYADLLRYPKPPEPMFPPASRVLAWTSSVDHSFAPSTSWMVMAGGTQLGGDLSSERIALGLTSASILG
jgi:hypothetical protein